MSENSSIKDGVGLVCDFMTSKGWQGYICPSCGKTFFSKTEHRGNTPICGRYRCNQGKHHFQSLSKRKKLVTPHQICLKLREHFSSLGFEYVDAMSLANVAGHTDLVIAGVQMFDPVIHGNHNPINGPKFIAQPCVRMQFQEHVQSQDGTSTSFVNVCTEKMNIGFEEHLQFVDGWCSALSKLGLHMNDFTIVLRTSEKDWGTGPFEAIEIFFSYGGLELGDAAYMFIPQVGRPSVSVSDIGFGLERIVWVMNKTGSYFDTLTPLVSSGAREVLDSFRTLSLLVLCGVKASNKGPGLQFRRFAKAISEKGYGYEVNNLLAHYFDYWSQFVTPIVDRDNAVQTARLEIDRFVNLMTSEKLNLPPPRGELTEAYLHRLVYTCNANIYEIRKVIQACKTQQ